MQSRSVPERQPRHTQNGSKHGGRPSTAPLVANEQNCRDAAKLLMLEEPQAALDAFHGEPLEAMLHVVRWCLANAEHPDYTPERMIRGWAKKRGRGKWSDRPTRGEEIIHGQAEPRGDIDEERENERLAWHLIEYWSEHPRAFVAVLDQVEAAVTGKKNGSRA